ncbi:DUF6284 family protein [Streptomyces sp. NRRL F-5135]|uniref:DUF6284 family protein n=1 Tax=Streptomyces sp. NRRL F-5135 TaxID=1463858 RepID=UPI0004C9BBA4|nr:DUF6284 family protein [Streptomyces sp. NRRL F-5135]
MNHIGARQALVTAAGYAGGPTAIELDAIEREMPLIMAEVDLLDAQITAMDRSANEVDARRIRRARRRVLVERREFSNRAATVTLPGGAA